MKDILIEKMYELNKKPYQKFFKKSIAWNVTPKELITYKEVSLGFHLGCFLLKYDFEFYNTKFLIILVKVPVMIKYLKKVFQH
jgi:uncharacterized membrane protein